MTTAGHHIVGTGEGDVEVIAGFPGAGTIAVYTPQDPDGPTLNLAPDEARALAVVLAAAADLEDPPAAEQAPAERPLRGGWAYPTGTARKAHYFPAGGTRSLCGSYAMFNDDGREDSLHGSPDNCSTCRRRGGWA